MWVIYIQLILIPSLFSYAIGESVMFKLRKANVLISGLGSVGVEIAKNLILGGIRNVTLHDNKPVTWHDLSAQYYVNESDLDKNRVKSCFNELAELNDSVKFILSTDQLSKEFVSQFDVSPLKNTLINFIILVGYSDRGLVRSSSSSQ
jgi:ubiquitin-activating enzyme E1